jgi:hypothetical protein
MPTAAVADASSDSGGRYRARGRRGGRASKPGLIPAVVDPVLWVNIKGGWYNNSLRSDINLAPKGVYLQ